MHTQQGAGNLLFWATFCVVGQPMAVLLYYYDATLMTAATAAVRYRIYEHCHKTIAHVYVHTKEMLNCHLCGSM